MPNSAISFNTSGLATTTSPGLVGTGAQTFAGVKTFQDGASIKGDTSGATIATGFVGQRLAGTERALTSVGAAFVTGATSCITLNKGVYLLFVKGRFLGNNTGSLIAFGPSSTANTRTPVDSIFNEGAASSYGMALATPASIPTTDSNVLSGLPYYLIVSADSTQIYPWIYCEDQTGIVVNVNMAAIRIA